jgi:cell division protein FtsQ
MKIRFKKSLVFSSLVFVLVVFIGFVERKDSERTLRSIEVNVKGIADVYFVNEKDILDAIKTEFPLILPGISMKEVDLNKIEKKVEQHPFVKNAEVFADLKGHLMIEITQYVPIARIVRPNAADGYISTEGKILPTSPQYTTRVMTLEGAYAESLLKLEDISSTHQDLMSLIDYIYADEFWKAQIVGLSLGKPRTYRRNSKESTCFMKKFSLSKVGNTYDRVNVKYKDQIICE